MIVRIFKQIMAMLLRTSKTRIALGLRVVCLLTVTLTFVVISVLSKSRQQYGSGETQRTGKLQFCSFIVLNI